jgi:hypothetical protein
MSDSLAWPTVSRAIATWVRGGSGLDNDHVFFAYEGKPRPPAAPYIVITVQAVKGVGHDWSTYEDNPLEFDPLTVTAVDTSANTLAIAAHPFANGDGPIRLTGALPAPLALATDYWVIYGDAGHVKLATSYANTGGQLPLGAGNTITPIDLTTTGSGTIQVLATADTVPAGKELAHVAQGFREVTLHLECIAPEDGGYAATVMLSNVIASLQLYTYDLDQAGVGISDFGQSFSQGGVQLLEGRRGGILEPRAMCDVTFYLASTITGFMTTVDSLSGTATLENEGGIALPAISVHIP